MVGKGNHEPNAEGQKKEKRNTPSGLEHDTHASGGTSARTQGTRKHEPRTQAPEDQPPTGARRGTNQRTQGGRTKKDAKGARERLPPSPQEGQVVQRTNEPKEPKRKVTQTKEPAHTLEGLPHRDKGGSDPRYRHNCFIWPLQASVYLNFNNFLPILINHFNKWISPP